MCDLKAERPGIGSEMTAKERGSLEENEERDLEEVEAGNGEKGQEDEREKKEVKEETVDEEEGDTEERRGADEEDELEVLRSQVVQLLLELEETREVSQRHEESYNELQGAYASNSCFYGVKSSLGVPSEHAQMSLTTCFSSYVFTQTFLAW